MKKTVLAICVPALFMASCGSGSAAGTGGDPVVKFHPLEQFCVTYEHGGMMSGTSEMCIRNWGAETYTIENFTISIAGFSQSQNSHKITIGDQIYAIDPATMTGTVTTNPMYEGISNADPEAITATVMEGLGMTDSGEDKTVAGYSCNVLTGDMGISGCFTDDMVMLEMDAMGATQTATSVDLDSGGDDANYNLWQQATITDGPDVGAILEQL